ncbi:hypothetical protein F4779DRAFT_587350 [Xylariaceae sp. FL0662B]|nr:hypothetical protein F4779DRAFT_587350 [Xylariaceae sp. FL0662B]
MCLGPSHHPFISPMAKAVIRLSASILLSGSLDICVALSNQRMNAYLSTTLTTPHTSYTPVVIVGAENLGIQVESSRR